MTGWDGDWPGWDGHDGAEPAGADGHDAGHDGGFDPGLPEPGFGPHDAVEDPAPWTHEADDGHAAPPPPVAPFAELSPDGPDHALPVFDGADPDPDLDGGELAAAVDPQEPDVAPFPPQLDLDLEPPDGSAWADPDLLGAEPGDDGAAPPVDPPPALLADLQHADGGTGAGWDALAGSDDPAVRALALFWSP